MQKCMTLEWLREVYVFYDKVNKLLSRYNGIRLYIQEDLEDFDTIPMNNIYFGWIYILVSISRCSPNDIFEFGEFKFAIM